MQTEQVDVLVVGGASAAYSAAVTARQCGAERVVVLEKATRDAVGGNARFSHTGFRFVHNGVEDLVRLMPESERSDYTRTRVSPYTAEDFHADLKRVTQDRIDPGLANLLVEESTESVHWMTGLGHQWEFWGPVEIDGHVWHNPGTAISPVGGGLGQVEHWISVGDGLGIELRTDSRVTALLGDHREVRGARVNGPDGEYEIAAGAVILASGGFQASAERRARYLGQNADLMKVRGSRHNTGEVLQMAIDLGAKTSGQWQGAHASPIDFNSPEQEAAFGRNRYGYPFGITIDAEGQRFFDEGEAHHSYTYAKTGWAVLRQHGGVAYQLFDQQSVGLLAKHYKNQTPVVADTIEDLAGQIGIEPAILAHTVKRFNESVRDDIAFDATKRDGRCTEGITPKKSNWARALTEPPFLAYGVTGGITFTFGGVQIDETARVRNWNGDPIDGLYANGDIIGLFYHNYPSCSGQTRNLVFGRRAGAAAAGRG